MKMFDSAVPPASFVKGERWGGYLKSPTAAVPWGQAKLQECIDAGALLLPIYVAPLTAPDFTSRPGHVDAGEAIKQLRRLRAGRLVVCADLEESAFEAAPAAAVQYLADFGARVREHHGVAVYYSSRSCLEAFITKHPHDTGRPWLALYTASHAVWPVPGWDKPRGWQYADDGKVRGHTVDLSTVDAGFPFMAAVKTVRLSPGHRVMVRTLTRAWRARKVGFPAADGRLVDELLAAGAKAAQLPRSG